MQNKKCKMKAFSAVVFFSFFIFYFVCVSLAAAQRTPAEVVREVGFDQKLNEQVPLDLVFHDETGRPVELREYFGEKPVILSLVFYRCPMLCNLELDGLVQALRGLKFDAGKEFRVLTVSFDPSETPALAAAKKKHYLEQYHRPGTESGWHFLTGNADAVRGLTRALGFRYTYDPETRQFAHASGLVVLTPEGRISRLFYGIEYAPRDLRLGLVEASAGRIGNAIDQVLLYCFHYDPATGKYGFVILTVIRVLGAVTVLALGTFVAVMLRRERRGELSANPQRS